MQVVVFHPGTQHSRQTARALHDLDRLAFLATSLAPAPGTPLAPLLARFALAGVPPERVRRHGLIELAERAAGRAGHHRLAARLDHIGNARFGRWLAGQAAKHGPDVALWGFNGSARTAFEDHRTRGMVRLLDRTIGDHRRWNRELAAIRETHAAWLGSECPIPPATIANDDAEYAAATHILVPSPFVAETLRAESPVPHIAERLVHLPYGYDPALFGDAPPPRRRPPGEPVRFLFVGQVTARKGIQHLAEAALRLPASAAQVTVTGPFRTPRRTLAPYAERIAFTGPVAQAALPAVMQAHDVLVLPSHFEGSAIVLLEALASGLAVIATPQAGLGPTPASGITLSRPAADAVEEAMLALIADRERLFAMRCAAQADARAHDFASYRARIAALLAMLEG